MDAIIKLLNALAGTGELITLAYGGGSRPGESRQATVISCAKADCRIHELGDTTPKQYKLAKILWAETSTGQRINNDAAIQAFQDGKLLIPQLPVFDTLDQYATHLRPELEQAGWYIHQDSNFLGVGNYLKNGKPRKTPSVIIAYQDRSTEVVWDLKTNGLVEIPREISSQDRPWRVDSWRLDKGKTFGRLDRAMELFIAEVRASDPKEATRAQR